MKPMMKVWWPAVLSSSVFSGFPLVFPPLSSSCACPGFLFVSFVSCVVGPWSFPGLLLRARLLVLGSSFP